MTGRQCSAPGIYYLECSPVVPVGSDTSPPLPVRDMASSRNCQMMSRLRILESRRPGNADSAS